MRPSLRMRVALSASLCAAVSIALVCLAIAWRAGQEAEAVALSLTETAAARAAALVEGDLRATYSVVRALTAALTAEKVAGRAPDRAQLNATLAAALREAPDWLGIASAWAPNALDGRDAAFAQRGPGTDASGRFISWWNRADGAVSVAPVEFSSTPGANDWYDRPCAERRDMWMDVAPFDAKGRTFLATTLVSPVLVEGRCLAVTAVDIELTSLQRRLQALALPMAARVALLSQRALYVSHPEPALLGHAAQGLPPSVTSAIHTGRATLWIDPAGWVHCYSPVRIAEGLPAWSVEVRFPVAEARRAAVSLAQWAALVGLLCVVVTVAVMLLLVTRATAPLVRLADTLSAMVAGSNRLEVQLPEGRRDELGRIAGAFNTFVQKLREAFRGISAAAAEVDLAAGEIASGNDDLSRRTEQQATHLQRVTGAVDDLVGSIEHNAAEAREAARVASTVVKEAQHAATGMAQAQEAMQATAQASRRIGGITVAIDDLAVQINLLALNAGVEAARAGDAGRGFAVVAAEVRRLAQRSTASAQDIRALVTETVGRIEQGHACTEAVDAAIRRLASTLAQVNQAVLQIESRCSAQVAAVLQVGGAVSVLDGMTQQNAALVEQAAAASAALRQQTERLFDAVRAYVAVQPDTSVSNP